MAKSDETLPTSAPSPLGGRIYSVRGLAVMLDSDLAEMYGVLTKNLRAYPVIKCGAGFDSGGEYARHRDKAMRDIGAERQRSRFAVRTKRRPQLITG